MTLVMLPPPQPHHPPKRYLSPLQPPGGASGGRSIVSNVKESRPLHAPDAPDALDPSMHSTSYYW
jgi:hypothetical protein